MHQKWLLAGFIGVYLMVEALKKSKVPTPAWLTPYLALGLGTLSGIIHGLTSGLGVEDAAFSAILGLASGSGAIAAHALQKPRDDQRKTPTLPIITMAIGFCLFGATGCSPATVQKIKAVEPIAEVACVVIFRTVEPGSESLCATAQEYFDAAIELATKDEHLSAKLNTAPAKTKIYDIIKANRAKLFSTQKAGGK